MADKMSDDGLTHLSLCRSGFCDACSWMGLSLLALKSPLILKTCIFLYSAAFPYSLTDSFIQNLAAAGMVAAALVPSEG